MARIYTASGTKVFIGPSAAAEPANAAAYAALSWVEIGALESVGEFGDESGAITGAIIGDGRTRKGKGARDAGTLAITCFHNPEDTGQQAMVAAEATNNNYTFKIVIPNRLTTGGTDEIDYFMGLVMSKRLNIGGNDNLVRRTFNTAVNSKLTEVAAT